MYGASLNMAPAFGAFLILPYSPELVHSLQHDAESINAPVIKPRTGA